jgi:hypothetical protein
MKERMVIFPYPPFQMQIRRWMRSSMETMSTRTLVLTSREESPANDVLWQEHWQQLVYFPSHAYGMFFGAIGWVMACHRRLWKS